MIYINNKIYLLMLITNMKRTYFYLFILRHLIFFFYKRGLTLFNEWILDMSLSSRIYFKYIYVYAKRGEWELFIFKKKYMYNYLHINKNEDKK